MQRKYKLKEKVFDTLTNELAYWLGFLYGDGNCTTENKIRVTLSQKDKEHLFSFRNFIGSEDRPIKDRTHQIGGKEYYSSNIEFRSWRVHNKIKKYELTIRKEFRKRLNIELLQPEIRRHFVRGVFDADGSFYYDGHKRQWLFAEITGYKTLLKDIKNILVVDGVISSKKKIVKNNSIFRLRLAKNDTINLIDYIYKGEPKFKMKRKYNLAQQYRERLNE